MLTTNLVFILFIVALTQQVDAAKKVLFIGDSWADNRDAENVFENNCVGSVVVNEAIGGTTAAQWRNYEGGSYLQAILDANTDAVSLWISLGGNDFLQSDCTDTEVVANMRAVVAKVTDVLPEAKILFIPYARFPFPDTKYTPCTSAAFEQYGTDLQAIANEFAMATFVDTFYLFGGSSNVPSNAYYWRDDIHINEQGYQLLWSDPVVKRVICPCISPDTEGCEIEAVPVVKCNFLTFILELFLAGLDLTFVI